jgi:benzodiazapine receptor
MSRQIVGLSLWIVITFLAAGFGAQFQPGEWYAQLVKPSWTPPNWVFAPVWTVLYLLMAIAAWLVWRPQGFAAARLALILFQVQLGLNALWSWLFFGQQRPGLAVIDITLLWLAILLTLLAFWRRDSFAGLLLLPYLAWVSYAAALNFAIWRLNLSTLP